MKIIKADKNGVKLAVKYLKAGKAVVYPTDTAYGLGVDATNAQAVKKMRLIKERGRKPVHVIVDSLPMAKKYVVFTRAEEKIFRKFLPGRLTMVLPLTPAVSRKGRGSGFGLLSAGTGALGIRVPDNQVALALSRMLKKPITTSSANPSAHLSHGRTPYSATDSYRQFLSKKYRPDLFLDAGTLKKISPSTIIRLEHGKIKLIRRGPIKISEIKKII